MSSSTSSSDRFTIGARRFVRWMLGVLGFTLVGVVAFNFVLDPYQVFGNDDWPGVNSQKLVKNQRFSKAYVVARGNHDLVTLGSSRGLRVDPLHPAFDGYSAYNLALPGATIHEILRYLQHAQGAHPLKTAVVGLDFFSFTSGRRAQSGFDDSRLLLSIDGEYRPLYQRLSDYGNALFSLDSFRASWRTLRRNGKRAARDDAGDTDPRKALGFGERKQRMIEDLGGHRQAALIIEKYCLKPDGFWLGVGQQLYRRDEYGFLARNMKDFERLLRFAHRRGIDLRLYISPIHARLQSAMKAVGVQEANDLWKRWLVSTNAEVALEMDREPFVIWDFANVNPYTTEPIPRDPDGVMTWYEETSHFRAVLADKVLSVVMETDAGDALLNEGFGRTLRSANIQPYLLEQYRAREHYRRTHPDDWQDIVTQARELHTLVPAVAAESS